MLNSLSANVDISDIWQDRFAGVGAPSTGKITINGLSFLKKKIKFATKWYIKPDQLG